MYFAHCLLYVCKYVLSICKLSLHSAGVEGSEDAGEKKSQEEEALMYFLKHCICVSRPCEILCDMNVEELKAV